MAVEAEDMAARLLAEFRYALENGQLVAYFQPEVELSSGRVVAAESLVRWEHPHLGTLPPSLFAPLAERPMSAEVFAGWCGIKIRPHRDAAEPGTGSRRRRWKPRSPRLTGCRPAAGYPGGWRGPVGS
jgi:hypothetical protein